LNWLVEHPADADVLAKLAEIAVNQKSNEEATLLLQRAVAADPSVPRRVALIEHLLLSSNPKLALGEIERLPDHARADFRMREIEATALGNLGLHEREIGVRQKMATDRPAEPRHWCRLANALRTVGRKDDAVKALRRATRAAPNYGEAWWALSNLKSYKFTSDEISAMRRALGRKLSDHDLLLIHFALGKALEDRGEFEQSFTHYSAANAIRAKSFASEQTITAAVDESIGLLTPEFFERNRGAGCTELGPIFVVGLHRAGSTLIEQILASHSMIEGTAELPVIGSIIARLEREARMSGARAIAALPRERFRSIGEEYLEKTRAYRKTDRPLFVDKMPGNWTSIGLIRAALPNAKIIDARRHPMACGFSNFKQHYPKGVAYSYRLSTIGIFYRDYWRFMRHFDQVQPGAVHRVINERLVEDPEREVRAMLDHVGLPFAEACLEFHKNDRAVPTPSAEQVRQPISSEGVGRWKDYEPWLGELKEALGAALEHWTE
jgi:tetratricopeptide (TPR) repeat protein